MRPRTVSPLFAAIAAAACALVPAAPAQQSLSDEQLTDLYRGPAQITVAGRETCVPVVGPRYLPLIETRINGRGPYRLLLDFGSNVVLLREDVARAAGVTFEIVREGPDIARVKKMRFGGLEARDILIGVYERLDVDGVISFHFFRDHALRLDSPGREFCIFDGPRPMEPEGDVLPLVVEDRIPYVEATVAGETISMFLDTGAADWFSFPLAVADSLPLVSVPVPGPVLSNNQTGDNRVQLARLASDLRIGPVSVRMPQVFLDPAIDRPFLGQSFLARFVLTLDSASRTVRLEGDHATPVVVPDFSSFGVALRFDDDEIHVSDRIPGSRAERLVPTGARVLRVNDVTAEELTELKWRAIRMTAEHLDLELEGSEHIIRLERKLIGAN